MAKRILICMILILFAGALPALPRVIARMLPLAAVEAWAEAQAGEKGLPSPAGAGEGDPREAPRAPEEAAEAGAEPEAEEAEASDEEEQEEEEEEGEGIGEAIEEILEDTGRVIDRTHARISKGIFDTAGWFDSFFGDERAVSEIQKSRLKLSFSAFLNERDGVRFDIRPNLRVELPLLKNRVNFLLAGDEEEKEFQPVPLQEVRQQFLDTSKTSFSASVRYFLDATLERNVSVQLGLRFPHGVPALFVEPRYRKSYLMDSWLLRFTQRVIALSNYTMEVRTAFDLDRAISEKMLFRHTVDGSWFSDQSGYFYGLQFSVFHRLSTESALEYSWNNFFRTSPSHNLEEIRLRVLYRHQIWRKWLFYEVAPQLTFPRSREYKYTPGILFRLEANFGAY